jgi:hypothetical protein
MAPGCALRGEYEDDAHAPSSGPRQRVDGGEDPSNIDGHVDGREAAAGSVENWREVHAPHRDATDPWLPFSSGAALGSEFSGFGLPFGPGLGSAPTASALGTDGTDLDRSVKSRRGRTAIKSSAPNRDLSW